MKKLTFFVIILIFLGILFFSTFKIYRRFETSPMFFLSRVNLIFITARPSVTIVSLESDKGIVMDLPVQNEVLVTRGFGKYKLGKVFELGELEGRGGVLLKETVEENYNLPLSGYIYFKDESKGIGELKEWRKIVLKAIRRRIKTDFNGIDLILLYLRSLRVKNEFYKTVGYSERSGYFQDGKIGSEVLSLTILNASAEDQLAQKWSILWEKIGGRVIKVANNEKEREELCLIGYKNSLERTYTVQYLKKFLGCSAFVELDITEERSDVVLVLGRGYWKKLTEKW